MSSSRFLIFLKAAVLLYSCGSNTGSSKPVDNDSIVNALNAADTVPKTQQKNIDSVNKIYLDSFKKHAADSTNAEYGRPH